MALLTYAAIGKWGKCADPDFTKVLNDNGFIEDKENPRFVFSLGGDGTFLDAVQAYKDKDVIFVGVNCGKLGFYANFLKDDILELIDLIKSNKYMLEEFNLLDIDVDGKNYKSINEVVCTNPVTSKVIDLIIDDNLFERFKGTGLLVCTPSGSTAYNKSLGGSILAPNIEAYQLTEIASINNNVYRSLDSSLVLTKDNILKLHLDNDDVSIIVDGNKVCDKASDITIRLADKKIKLMIKKDSIFLDRVKKSFLK